MIAFWCGVLGVALIACSLRLLQPTDHVLLALSAAMTVAFCFLLHEQIVSKPWMASYYPLWADTAKALDEPISAVASIARNQAWFSIGGPLLAILTLTVSFIVSVDRRRAWQLVWVTAWAGAAYAIFSIAAFLFEPTKVLWRDKSTYLDALTGTFINRNTAATFFGSISVLWLLIALEKIRALLPDRDFSMANVARRVLNNATRGLVVSIVMLLLCLTAMFLTRSRAGVVLSLGALLVALTCSYRRLLPTRIAFFSLIAIGGAVSLLLLQTLGAGVGGRFDLEGVVDDGRVAAYRSTWHMISDRPWFGTGLGTFDVAFPAYRSGEISLWGTWTRAHNTLLEIASNVGIPLTVAIVAGWIFIFALLIRGVMRRRRDLALPTAGLSIAALGIAHSMVDFSLQIPGYAIPFYAIVGSGIAQSYPQREVANGSAPVRSRQS